MTPFMRALNGHLAHLTAAMTSEPIQADDAVRHATAFCEQIRTIVPDAPLPGAVLASDYSLQVLYDVQETLTGDPNVLRAAASCICDLFAANQTLLDFAGSGVDESESAEPGEE